MYVLIIYGLTGSIGSIGVGDRMSPNSVVYYFMYVMNDDRYESCIYMWCGTIFNVCGFCAVVEILENLAFLANASNLVLYLRQYMHMSPSKSANNVTNFMGTAFLLALLGGFLSDAFFTTYHIYLISAVIEFLVCTLYTINFSLWLITL